MYTSEAAVQRDVAYVLETNGVLAANYQEAKLEEGYDVTFEVKPGHKKSCATP